MSNTARATVLSAGLVTGFIVIRVIPGDAVEAAYGAAAPPPASTLHLHGVVRDFSGDHADFDQTVPAGHYAQNVSPLLGPSGVPTFTSGGVQITEQWYDRDNNPIMPYGSPAGDPGLPGGHFDVDVFDEATSREEYHEHEFDDEYDVTHIDIANDENLLFDEILEDYDNDVRIEFVNEDRSGAGTYTFQVGNGPVQTGYSSAGLNAVFHPDDLTQLRVDFNSLLMLNPSSPSRSQRDVANRNGSFSIRMFDVDSAELVYEVVVYHHTNGSWHGRTINFGGGGDPEPMTGNDACGVPLNDTVGEFGRMGTGGVASQTSFDQWYRDTPRVNASRDLEITLTKGDDGVFEYYTDEFFPIDGEMFGNEGEAHNSNFTYAIEAEFVYRECEDQFFEFAGQDDAWLFIDDKLVMDMGGTDSPSRQYVAADRLNLVDGETYSFKFFYAHRRATPTSLFHMRTNMMMTTWRAGRPTSSLYD